MARTTARRATRRAAARRAASAPATAVADGTVEVGDAAASVRATRADGNGDGVGELIGTLREQLAGRVLEPMNLVMIAADRIQEAVDDAVERGRVTHDDASDLVSDLVRRGREQTDDVLGNLDELLGRGIDQLEALARRLEQRSARAARGDSVDRLMQSADRVRRAVGVGPTFPILGYEKLTVARVKARLGDLTEAELRTVRRYEAAHANRRAVLAAIDRALG